MARPPRLQIAGAWYHAVARGIERRDVFRRDRDREHFLELIALMAERFACNVTAYVLMKNHFHLFLQTLEPNLSRAMQWLMTSYSAWFNRRYNRAGHLFQGRFKAVVVDPANWAVSLTRYIHLNPVRVQQLGLDKTQRQRARHGLNEKSPPELVRKRIATLREYRWSSYPAYAGQAKAPEWLKVDWILRHGGRGASEQRRWYRQYCEEAIREGVTDAIEENVFQQMCLGGREFLQGLLEKHGDKKKRELRTASLRPTVEQVKDAVARARQQPWESFASRHGDWGRDLAVHLANEMSGKALEELGQAFGVSRSGVCMASRRIKERAATDKELRRALETTRKWLSKN